MGVKELAEQIQVLQDIETIKQLKYEYSRGCDLNVNKRAPEAFLRLFKSDAVWQAEYGCFSGLDELKVFADSMQKAFKFTYHFFTNPIIEVNGSHATGCWRLIAVYTETDGQDTMLVGIEDDKYEKVKGKWLFKEITLTTGFYATLKEGWSKVVPTLPQ